MITLVFQSLLRFDHREHSGYQSLSCHNTDESQMTHICKNLGKSSHKQVSLKHLSYYDGTQQESKSTEYAFNMDKTKV